MTETKKTIGTWVAVGTLFLQSMAMATAAPMREPDSLVLPTLGTAHSQGVSERIEVPASEMAPAFTGMMPDELSSWMQQKSVREAEQEAGADVEIETETETEIEMKTLTLTLTQAQGVGEEPAQEQGQFEFTGLQPEQMSSWVEQLHADVREAPGSEQDAASVAELEESIAESIAELQTAEFISDIVAVLQPAESA